MKLVKLSASSTGHLYLPENILGTHFCQRPRFIYDTFWTTSWEV